MLTFSICPPPRAALAARPRRAPKVNLLLPSLKLNSLPFFKSPKSSAHASGAWRHLHPPVTISFWDFYFDICEWHILPACAWTPVLMLPLTNPCAKRKVLTLTKPKGKMYKTKSLGYYVTSLWGGLTPQQKCSQRILPRQSTKVKVNLAIVVEGDLRAPFSIAITPRCREERNSFRWIAPLDTFFIVLSVKQGGIKYQFLSLWLDSTGNRNTISRVISKNSAN